MFKKMLFSIFVLLLVFISFVEGKGCGYEERFVSQDFNCDGIVNLCGLAIFVEY
jgi:hypothetical protein